MTSYEHQRFLFSQECNEIVYKQGELIGVTEQDGKCILFTRLYKIDHLDEIKCIELAEKIKQKINKLKILLKNKYDLLEVKKSFTKDFGNNKHIQFVIVVGKRDKT